MIEADQAKIVYKYKSTKIKLFKTNLSIKFNKKCLHSKVIPKYVCVNIKSNTKTATITKRKAQLNWIKNEIKNLYGKKNELNYLLYKVHLELLNKLDNRIINDIITKINEDIRDIMKKIIKTKNKKFQKLYKQQKNPETIKNTHKLYPRLVNLTNIQFSNREIKFLNKGLDYNLPEFKVT